MDYQARGTGGSVTEPRAVASGTRAQRIRWRTIAARIESLSRSLPVAVL